MRRPGCLAEIGWGRFAAGERDDPASLSPDLPARAVLMNLLPAITMTPTDLDEVMLLERRCFKDPWTRHMYLSDLTSNPLATYLVLRTPAEMSAREPEQASSSSLLAYGGFWLLLDEAHIATIASHPRWRRCGLGLWLMLALLEAGNPARCSALHSRSARRQHARPPPVRKTWLRRGGPPTQLLSRRRRRPDHDDPTSARHCDATTPGRRPG